VNIKLVFTALAMVAFSGIAMANTLEVNESLNTVESNGNLISIIYEDGDCTMWAVDTLDNFDRDNELTPIEAHNAYQELIALCEAKMQ
jgi:hypothetical protein